MSVIPTLTLIFVFFFTVEKMSIYKVLGCIIAFLGVAIGMSSGLAQTVFSNSILLGDCIMIAAMIHVAIFSVFSRSYFHKYGAWLVKVISISVGFLGLSLFFLGLFEVSSLRTLSGSEIIYSLVLGTVGVPIQFGLFAWSISHLGPSCATM